MKRKISLLLALLSALLLLAGCGSSKGIDGNEKEVRISIHGEAEPADAVLSKGKGALVVDPRKVTSLSLSSPSNEDLKALKYFVNLKFLRIDNAIRRNKEETLDLSLLEDLPLVGLSLAGFDAKKPLALKSLAPLGNIETLAFLDLEYCQVTRVADLKSLTGLRRLSIRDGREIKIEDLAELSDLIHLGEMSPEVEEARGWKYGPYASAGSEPLLGLLLSNGNSREEMDAVMAAISAKKAGRAADTPAGSGPEPAEKEALPAPSDGTAAEHQVPLLYFKEHSGYAFDEAGNVLINYTLEAYDGAARLIWSRTWDGLRATETGVSETVAYDGKVYKELYGTLYCLDVRSGELLWENGSDVGGGAILCPYNGRLYLTCYYGNVLTCLDRNTGAKIWAIEDQDKYWGHTLYAEDGAVTVGYGTDGEFMSVDWETGQVIRGWHGDAAPDKKISWERAFASSVLENNEPRYGPLRVLDNNPETAWSEGANGYGVGEWIQIERDTPAEVVKIHIRNGYHKFPETYDNNGKLKAFRLDFSDGSSLTYIVDTSEYRGETDLIIPLSRPVSTHSICLTILDAIPGERYEDTCISDIAAYSR